MSNELLFLRSQPSNIFFSPDGQIKIGDFGLVTEIVEDHDLIVEQKKQSVYNGTHTANVGTELYMSPEQVSCFEQNSTCLPSRVVCLTRGNFSFNFLIHRCLASNILIKWISIRWV